MAAHLIGWLWAEPRYKSGRAYFIKVRLYFSVAEPSPGTLLVMALPRVGSSGEGWGMISTVPQNGHIYVSLTIKGSTLQHAPEARAIQTRRGKQFTSSGEDTSEQSRKCDFLQFCPDYMEKKWNFETF